MSSNELRQPKAPEQHRFHFLDGMRGLAAFFVVLNHVPRQFAPYAPVNSYTAVDFFFCLSGFVVAFSYQTRLETTLGFREFTLTRLIRLYPAAIAGTILGALCLPYDHSALIWRSLPLPLASLYAIVSGLLILPLFRGLLFPLDVPMWTLFLELLINLAFGLLTRLRLAGTAVLLGIVALSLVGLVHDRAVYQQLGDGYNSYSAIVGVHRVCFSFFAGVVLYRLYMSRRPAWIHGMRAVLLVAGSVVALLILFYIPAPTLHATALDILDIVVLFPVLVYLGARVQLPSFTTRTLAVLGAISYPLYILHFPLLQPIGWLRIKSNAWIDSMVFAYIILVVGFAWLATKFYDEPVRRTITRRLRARRPPYSAPLPLRGQENS